MRFKPQIKKLDRVGDPITGLLGLNTETLTGNKTLIPNVNKIYQFLNPNGSNRNVYLSHSSASKGNIFIIENTGDFDDQHYLSIYDDAIKVDEISSVIIRKYIYDGSNFTRESNINIAIGSLSRAYNNAIAIGRQAIASIRGIAIGKGSSAGTDSIAIGYNTYANKFTSVVGAKATAEKKYSTAIGYNSKTYRNGEIANHIKGSEDYNITTCGWSITTTNNTPTEMRAGGEVLAKYGIKENSCLSFTIIVTARDNTSGDCASYKFEGLIKRDGANNTIMSVCNKTVVHEDDASWDCNVTADDVNESLKIEVTGDATNVVQWVARLDGVETIF